MLDADGQLLVSKGDVIHLPKEISLPCILHRSHHQPDSTPTPAPASVNTQFPDTVFPDTGDDLNGERTIAMELLSLRSGDMLTVCLTAGAGQTEGTARIIGYNPQHHLLIIIPINGGHVVIPVRDELVDAHAFSGEGVAIFKCVTTTVSRIPSGYVMLSPPRRIENRASRKSLRMRTNVTGKMLVGDDPPRIIHISNISTTDMSSCSTYQLGVSGAPVCLRFRVKTHDYRSELVVATLMHSGKPVDLPNVYQHGVEFVGLVVAQKVLP